MIARSSGAMRSSVQPFACAPISSSSSSLRSSAACASARVNDRRVALEDVVELAAGDVVLVEREDGGAALVGAAGHAWRDRSEPSR